MLCCNVKFVHVICIVSCTSQRSRFACELTCRARHEFIYLYCIVSGPKITIFDQYLALGSMTAGASSVVNSFDRVVKFITADADDDRHTSLDFVYDSKADVVFAARCYA